MDGSELASPNELAFLEHYGVKGMKWGVRRGASRTGKGGKRTKAAGDPLIRTRKLNDKQLQDLVNRLRLEKQYLELTAPKRSAGRELANSILKKTGNILIDSLVTAPVRRALQPKTKSNGT